MIVKFPYGNDHYPLDLRGFRVRALAPSAPPGRNAAKTAADALDAPMTGPSLVDVARGRRSVTVVVPDATRKASLPDVLPVVLERVRKAGIEERSITVLIATGTHPPAGSEGVATLVGPLPPGVRVVEHDSRAADLVSVGELRPGLPLRLNPHAVECECLITIGTVRHHYFAGFGGGPKMVFPGVGGYREIQANHGLVLALEGNRPVREPACEPGVLDGNPVAEEIARAAELRLPDIALCLVEGREGGVAWAGAGPWKNAFSAAVERVRSWFEVAPGDPFELMIVCAGGTPTDTTLIQAHKSLDAACRFLEPGGELLWLASLDGGLGSNEMDAFVKDPEPEAILGKLSTRWVQYGHTTLRIVDKTARHRVRLHSHLDPGLAERLGFEPTTDPEALLQGWRESRPGAQVGVMASGAVYPRLA